MLAPPPEELAPPPRGNPRSATANADTKTAVEIFMYSMSSYFCVNLQGNTTIFMTLLHCNIMILGKAKVFLLTTSKCQYKRYLSLLNGNLSPSFDIFVCSIAIVCLLGVRLRITTWLKKVFSYIQ